MTPLLLFWDLSPGSQDLGEHEGGAIELGQTLAALVPEVPAVEVVRDEPDEEPLSMQRPVCRPVNTVTQCPGSGASAVWPRLRETEEGMRENERGKVGRGG